MNRRLFSSFLAIAALAVMTLPAVAKESSSTAIKATITVASTSKVGSSTLAPGDYDVVIDGNQAKFMQYGKLVAEVPCTMKELSAKAHRTGFEMDHDQMSQLEISGKTTAIEFSTSPASGN